MNCDQSKLTVRQITPSTQRLEKHDHKLEFVWFWLDIHKAFSIFSDCSSSRFKQFRWNPGLLKPQYILFLLKTELRMSDFKHFYWLAGHRLSVHTSVYPVMVKERVSNKASWKHFCSSEKKWPTKTVLDQNKINMEELLILEFLINQLFYSGLLEITWL